MKKLNITLSIINIIITIYIGLSTVIIISKNTGTSMMPTIPETYWTIDYNIKYFNVKRGDVIVFRSPNSWDNVPGNTDFQPNELLEKRVIGKPGDNLRITNTGLFVNGTQYLEYNSKKIQPFKYLTNDIDITLTGYFVIGDNYKDSLDSFYLVRSNFVTESQIPAENIKYISFRQNLDMSINKMLYERKIRTYDNIQRFIEKGILNY